MVSKNKKISIKSKFKIPLYPSVKEIEDKCMIIAIPKSIAEDKHLVPQMVLNRSIILSNDCDFDKVPYIQKFINSF